MKQIFLGFFLMAFVPAAWSQTNIWLSSGLEFGSVWCYDDRPVQIVGQPADGFFSGCGISSANGRWYFNPAQAGTGELTFPLLCSIVYTSPDGDTAMRALRIHKPVVPHAGNDRPVCDGGKFTLSAEMLYVGDYTYSWLPEEHLVNANAKETGGFVADSQTFVVYVRDTLTGCSGMDSVKLINKSVYAGIGADKAHGCVRDSVFLYATDQDTGWQYRWDMGDGISLLTAHAGYVYQSAGFYPVTLTVGNGSCTDQTSMSFEVAELHLELTGPDRIDPDAVLLLETHADRSYTVRSWFPSPAFPDQNAYRQQIIPDTAREYLVVGISDKGCVDTAVHTVIVNPRTMMPSAFSPNGDGRNDRFRLVTWGEPSIIRTFRVFDRWGKQVFAAVGNAADTGWDGLINGVAAETGVYYYAIELESAGESLFYKGDVMLMR